MLKFDEIMGEYLSKVSTLKEIPNLRPALGYSDGQNEKNSTVPFFYLPFQFDDLEN